MKISMRAEFYILKKADNGEYIPITEQDVSDISAGGYSFDIGKYELPFDWAAFEMGWDKDGFLALDTGYGWFFNDFDLDECYDEHYANLGLSREDISAEFLASAHHIDDFYINFISNEQECEVGSWKANSDPDAAFRLQLLKVTFEDRSTYEVYPVDSKVLDAFNRGEKLLDLGNVLGDAVGRSQGAATQSQMKDAPFLDGINA